MDKPLKEQYVSVDTYNYTAEPDSPGTIYDLSTMDILPKIFSYLSAHAKITVLPLINKQFKRAVFEKAAWASVTGIVLTRTSNSQLVTQLDLTPGFIRLPVNNMQHDHMKSYQKVINSVSGIKYIELVPDSDTDEGVLGQLTLYLLRKHFNTVQYVEYALRQTQMSWCPNRPQVLEFAQLLANSQVNINTVHWEPYYHLYYSLDEDTEVLDQQKEHEQLLAEIDCKSMSISFNFHYLVALTQLQTDMVYRRQSKLNPVLSVEFSCPDSLQSCVNYVNGLPPSSLRELSISDGICMDEGDEEMQEQHLQIYRSFNREQLHCLEIIKLEIRTPNFFTDVFSITSKTSCLKLLKLSTPSTTYTDPFFPLSDVILTIWKNRIDATLTIIDLKVSIKGLSSQKQVVDGSWQSIVTNALASDQYSALLGDALLNATVHYPGTEESDTYRVNISEPNIGELNLIIFNAVE